MRRFFLPGIASSAETATISGPDAHHLRNVLRLKCGDKIMVFDGTGCEYMATISAMTSKAVTLRIEKQMAMAPEAEDLLRLSIGQAILKAQKMDFLVQKMTELGVSALYPFTCERSIPTVKTEKLSQKKNRWEKIAVEASKQCQRGTLLLIHDPQPLTSLLVNCQKHNLKIILWEKSSDTNLRKVLTRLPVPETVCALIGPEGGFSAREADKAIQAGFIPVGLGPRILRAETAALAITSIIQYELGSIP